MGERLAWSCADGALVDFRLGAVDYVPGDEMVIAEVGEVNYAPEGGRCVRGEYSRTVMSERPRRGDLLRYDGVRWTLIRPG